MGLISKFFNNARRPEGFLGKLMVNGMNGGGHARMANWALSLVPARNAGRVLDIGCGGGANISRLLKKYPEAKVSGIDFSPVSVAKSKKVNASAISRGRCDITEGSVVKLPYEKGNFDLITAFETIYFWPEIDKCFASIRQLLKGGGSFVIVNESDGTNSTDEKWENMIDGMHTYKSDEIVSLLKQVGFKDITVTKNQAKHWLMVSASA